jgi:hypothetical protein
MRVELRSVTLVQNIGTQIDRVEECLLLFGVLSHYGQVYIVYTCRLIQYMQEYQKAPC